MNSEHNLIKKQTSSLFFKLLVLNDSAIPYNSCEQ
jgi:hypothetical protein